MKLGVVSLLETGGCVSSAACRTSALLADFDLAHWDTAGTASVKITFLCINMAFLQPSNHFVEGKIPPSVVLLHVFDAPVILAVVYFCRNLSSPFYISNLLRR